MADKQLWEVTPVAPDVKNDDGVIIGGTTAGTRYAPLTLIANFVHNLWASFVNALTAKTSFASGDKIPVVNGSTATAMDKDTLLELTAQNALFGSDAKFSSTKMVYNGDRVFLDNANRKIVFSGNLTILYGTSSNVLNTANKEVSYTAVGSSFSGTRQGVLVWNVTNSVLQVKQYDSAAADDVILMTIYFDRAIGSGSTASTSTKILAYSAPFQTELSSKEFVGSMRKNSYKFCYNSDYVTIDNYARTISFSGNTIILAAPANNVTLLTNGKSTSYTAVGSSFSGTKMGVVVFNTTSSALYVRQYDKVQDDDYVLITLFFNKAIGSGSTATTDTLVKSYSTTLPVKFVSSDSIENRVDAIEKSITKSVVNKTDSLAGLGDNEFAGYSSIGTLTPGVRYYVYVRPYRHTSATSGMLFAIRKGSTIIDGTSVGNNMPQYYTFVAEEGAKYSWGGRCDSDDTMDVEFLTYKKTSDVVNACMPVLSDALLPCGKLSRTASFMYVTDLHGNLASLELAVELRRDNFTSVPIICGGDIPSLGPLDSGSADFIDSYIALCQKSVVYMVIGQHEVGFAPQANPTALRGRQKSLTLSTQQAFDRFIAPLKSSWGLPTLDKCYYYKDFGKVRLITLYQYDRPEVDDPNDSSLWKYQRALLWYGQEQIDWFIDTLNDMASGQIAVILMHQPPKGITKTDNKFGAYNASAPNKIADDPITEIIAAYNGRTTLSKTYEPTDPTTYLPSDGFSVTVNEDFSSAVGKVGFTIQGDNHTDSVGKYTGTDILALCLTSSRSPNDGVITSNTGMLSDYIVNAIGVNEAGKLILSRCGQQYFMGSVRDTELLVY